MESEDSDVPGKENKERTGVEKKRRFNVDDEDENEEQEKEMEEQETEKRDEEKEGSDESQDTYKTAPGFAFMPVVPPLNTQNPANSGPSRSNPEPLVSMAYPLPPKKRFH